MKITVIGGANVDIFAKSRERIIHGDSNPAVAGISAGGVARNIAENLARFGTEVSFITAVGDDLFGNYLKNNCESCGINAEAWIVRNNKSTGVYMATLDKNGELYAAFNAMDVLETVTAKEIYACENVIRNSDLLVLDTNMNEKAIEAAVLCGVPVMVDTVSAAKAVRIARLLPNINILKTNRTEAAVLTGLELNTLDDINRASEELLLRGVGRVFITLGMDGVCAGDSSGVIHVPAPTVDVRNVTGAGDALSAGVAFFLNRTLVEQAEFGIRCAAVTLEFESAVNPNIGGLLL